jgi:hypothetical protein
MIAMEVKGRDVKFTWEIIGIYRALDEGMWGIESCNTNWFLGKVSEARHDWRWLKFALCQLERKHGWH